MKNLTCKVHKTKDSETILHCNQVPKVGDTVVFDPSVFANGVVEYPLIYGKLVELNQADKICKITSMEDDQTYSLDWNPRIRKVIASTNENRARTLLITSSNLNRITTPKVKITINKSRCEEIINIMPTK